MDKSTIGLTGLAGITISSLIGGGLAIENLGTEIYKGDINGLKVTYVEGDHVARGASLSNWMEVEDGKVTYHLEDATNERNLDWRHFPEDLPQFQPDQKLEYITIKDPTNPEIRLREIAYDRKGKLSGGIRLATSDMEMEHITRVFEKADKLYNDMRREIRNFKSGEYEADQVEREAKTDAIRNARLERYHSIEDQIPQLDEAQTSN